MLATHRGEHEAAQAYLARFERLGAHPVAAVVADHISGRLELRALWRTAAAMLVAPVRRRMLMTRLRRDAMTCGPAPVRTWEWSSAKVTSRTRAP